MSPPLTERPVTIKPDLRGRTILQIVPELAAGGVERTCVDIAYAIHACGARALVASQGGRLVADLEAVGGIWSPFPAKTKNPLRLLFNILTLIRLIRREKVDLVHARSRAPAWSALLACRYTNTPFVTTWAGSHSGRTRLKRWYNSIMGRGDTVIANSHYTAAQIARLYPPASERCVVIERGTDMRLFDPQRITPQERERQRLEWDVLPDQTLVLLAARLTRWKGQLLLIEAARHLRGMGFSQVRYVLAGDAQGRGTYVQEIDAAIATADLVGIVRRVGHISAMPLALAAADIVVVPSTQPEAFGRVAVEAQAMGRCVVVSDHGAVAETVAEHTGWKVPPDDAHGLAHGLAAALTLSPEALEVRGQIGRAHVLTRFSLTQMQASTVQLYASLLQK